MAEVKQTTVNPSIPTSKKFGTRNHENLKSAFSSSPILSGEYTDESLRDLFSTLVIDGTVVGGLGINTYNRDFLDAPDLSTVETGGEGLPATPYVPNLTSPGPGSVFPSDQPPFEGEIPDPGVEFGVGLGSLTSPNVTAPSIASESTKAVTTIGSYIMGRSFKGSDGQS
jgi:hypothetical protein